MFGVKAASWLLAMNELILMSIIIYAHAWILNNYDSKEAPCQLTLSLVFLTHYNVHLKLIRGGYFL